MDEKEHRSATLVPDTPRPTVVEAVQSFHIPGRLIDVQPHRVGHIHDSYVSSWQNGTGERRYLHQRLNQYVFPDVASLMDNLQRVTGHLRRSLQHDAAPGERCLELVRARNGESLVQDSAGRYWRCFHFIEGTVTLENCSDAAQAFEAGRAFGRFVAQLSDLAPAALADTIPNFLNTPHRYGQLWRAVEQDRAGRVQQCRGEIDFARGGEAESCVLVEALGKQLPWRVIHYDPKLNNLLFDESTGRAVCVVDLDTCMAGTLLYDLGDLIRSAAVPCPEDEPDPSRVYVELEFLDAILEGYLGESHRLLEPGEVSLMADAPRIMAITLGIRFLADHLNGDRYFKTDFEGHNLQRARTQFQIARSLEELHDPLRNRVLSHCAALLS